MVLAVRLSALAVGASADMLEAAEADRAQTAKLQQGLYRIAELASAAQDMQEFYRAVHEVVGELMDAEDLFIALYDEERRRISWPYFAGRHVVPS